MGAWGRARRGWCGGVRGKRSHGVYRLGSRLPRPGDPPRAPPGRGREYHRIGSHPGGTERMRDSVDEDKQIFLSPEMTTRLGAIDIGSNSVRLIVAEALRGGNYRIIDEEREPTRLGRSVSTTGRLDDESMARTVQALGSFRQIAAGYQVTALRTIATCAVREAANGAEFCRRVRGEVGLDVEVISAEREARLAFASVANAIDLAGRNVVVADIGGGSTEIVYATGTLIDAIFTTPLGAVRLTEAFAVGDAVGAEAFAALEGEIASCLKKRTTRPPFAPQFLVGSGGTFTTLAELVMAAKRESNLPVAGYRVSHAEIRHLLDRLRKTPLRARRELPGMTPDRADIIIAGLSIIDGLLKRFRCNTVVVHTRGVRDGLLREMIDEALGSAAGPADLAGQREAAIERLAAVCSGEAEHGRQVAHLAGRLFEQLATALGLEPGDRELLQWAARLQDVGYVINYDQHHKHSYHLIRNARLPGMRPQDLEIVANVARYHRGALPKKKHENLARLSADEQRRVEGLAGILRLAGGLDRSRSQQVRDVRVAVDDDAVRVEVVADADPLVDIWGAERRTDLFERAFRLPVTVVWAEHGDGADGRGKQKGRKSRARRRGD
ncbi:MAG: Ppx/GppA family phosphatase [Planctomycetes bacterium]|nr:Ppx/GppA family phosphatase [Planctomycetota bacterium]